MRTEDEDAFEAFVAARSGDLLRTAVLLTRDRGHAEDLLQTALVKAYRRWGRIDGDPYPYVRRVLVTSAASWRRLRTTQEIVSLPALDRTTPDGTDVRPARDPGRSGAARPAEQEAADDGEHDGEDELTDAHAGLVAGEPRHRRHEEDGADAEHEQADQPLATGVPRGGGTRG